MLELAPCEAPGTDGTGLVPLHAVTKAHTKSKHQTTAGFRRTDFITHVLRRG
jgi:hypothetical protein